MTPEILQALNDSIAHWERMATDTRQPGEEIGCSYCALCQLFDSGDSCDGCPIMKSTGFDLCRDTPYGEASDALYASGAADYSAPAFLAAAQVELEFLRSLLP